MPIAPTSARSIACLITVARDQISHSDAMMVTVIKRTAPQLVAARDLFDRFQNMVTSKTHATPEGLDWNAESSLLATFAKDMLADKRAIQPEKRLNWIEYGKGTR
jgi:hypothetical protein